MQKQSEPLQYEGTLTASVNTCFTQHPGWLVSHEDGMLGGRQAECALQVREYEYDPDHQQESQAASQSLQSDAQAKRSQLEEWSATAYGEVYCP